MRTRPLAGEASEELAPVVTHRGDRVLARRTMDTTTPYSDKRTGYRPTYILLGTDAADRSHVYRTADETVHVVRGTERVHVEALDGRSVDEWMAFVNERVGWTRAVYGVGIAEMTARALKLEAAD